MATAWNVVVGVACACLCGSARADVVKLAELEARALERRPERAASQARIHQADAEIQQAESAYWPTLSAGLDGSLAPGRELLTIRQDGKEYLVSGAQTLGEPDAWIPHPRYSATLSARGSIYDFGRTSAALEAARAKQRASQADARAHAQVVVLEVRAAYLRWSVAHALWEIAAQAYGAARARAERIAGLIAEGAAPRASQTPVAASANAAASEAERAALELDTARLELGFLSARDLGPDARPEPELLAGAVAPPPTAAGLAVEAIERAREAAEARRKAAARADAPVLGYRVSGGIEGQDGDVFPAFGLGVGLSLPLWDAGGTAAGEAAARAAVSELTARAAAERAREQHANARRAMQQQRAARLVALAQEAVTLAETRVKQLEAGETLGNDVQEALAEAESDRARVKAELVRAQASIAQLELGL